METTLRTWSSMIRHRDVESMIHSVSSFVDTDKEKNKSFVIQSFKILIERFLSFLDWYTYIQCRNWLRSYDEKEDILFLYHLIHLLCHSRLSNDSFYIVSYFTLAVKGSKLKCSFNTAAHNVDARFRRFTEAFRLTLNGHEDCLIQVYYWAMHLFLNISGEPLKKPVYDSVEPVYLVWDALFEHPIVAWNPRLRLLLEYRLAEFRTQQKDRIYFLIPALNMVLHAAKICWTLSPEVYSKLYDEMDKRTKLYKLILSKSCDVSSYFEESNPLSDPNESFETFLNRLVVYQEDTTFSNVKYRQSVIEYKGQTLGLSLEEVIEKYKDYQARQVEIQKRRLEEYARITSEDDEFLSFIDDFLPCGKRTKEKQEKEKEVEEQEEEEKEEQEKEQEKEEKEEKEEQEEQEEERNNDHKKKKRTLHETDGEPKKRRLRSSAFHEDVHSDLPFHPLTDYLFLYSLEPKNKVNPTCVVQCNKDKKLYVLKVAKKNSNFMMHADWIDAAKPLFGLSSIGSMRFVSNQRFVFDAELQVVVHEDAPNTIYLRTEYLKDAIAYKKAKEDNLLRPEHVREYLKIGLFRYFFGLPDFNIKHVLIHDGRLYSFHDHNAFTETDLKTIVGVRNLKTYREKTLELAYIYDDWHATFPQKMKKLQTLLDSFKKMDYFETIRDNVASLQDKLKKEFSRLI